MSPRSAGDPISTTTMAHSLRVARRFCPLSENIHEVFTFLAQVIHKDKTSAVLPPRPWREGVSYIASPRKVGSTLKASSTSLLSSMSVSTPKVPPVLMLRSHGSSYGIWRSIHTSEATRTTLKEKFPWVEPVLHSGQQHRKQSATGCRCVQEPSKCSVSW